MPIDGPFVTKAAAFDAAEHLKGQIMTDSTKKNPAQTGSTTETKKETIRETERAAERKPDDPSDNAASRDTITGGTSPSKSGE